MLRGELVTLRAREASDDERFAAELYDDVEEHSRSAGVAWRPLNPGALAFPLPESAAHVANFSVVVTTSGELAGLAVLWGIDAHNRRAHLGLTLFPSFRGRGYGSDVVAVLCRYGFSTLGLHRLALETLADNAAMQRAAERSGFVLEGRMREASWANGAFHDEVRFGLLADDWRARNPS